MHLFSFFYMQPCSRLAMSVEDPGVFPVYFSNAHLWIRSPAALQQCQLLYSVQERSRAGIQSAAVLEGQGQLSCSLDLGASSPDYSKC